MCTNKILTTSRWTAAAACCAIAAAPDALNAQDVAAIPENLQRENLVAWCIVPFDASGRGPQERAEMLKRLGLRRCAYDWRDEHVPEFEEEIEAYRDHGIEYFAFWAGHPEAARLFEKHGLSPQVWVTCPSPEVGGDDGTARVRAAADSLEPAAALAAQSGSALGLYNHGGWGGEPENLVAVCEELRRRGHAATGIVYNLHHAHHRAYTFASDLELLEPYLLCLNLNGTDPDGTPKILTIGQGKRDQAILRELVGSGYRGPVGVIDHQPEADAEKALRANLEGLEKLLAEIPAGP